MTKSRTSRATLANVLGGKFSELPVPPAAAATDEEVLPPVSDRVDDSKDGLAEPGSDEEALPLESDDEKSDPLADDVDAVVEAAAADAAATDGTDAGAEED